MTLGPIVRIWGAMNYEPNFMVISRLCEGAKTFKKDFEHWQLDGTSFTFFNRDKKHEMLRATVKRIGFELSNPEKPKDDFMRLANVARQFAKELGCSTLTRVGIKLVVYADLDLPFAELCAQVRPLCLPQDERLIKLTSSDVTDVALNFDYGRNGNTVALRVGPMKKRQGIEMLHKLGTIEGIYPPADENGQWIGLLGSVPESFLYFDADTYFEGSCNIEFWGQFTEDNVGYELELLDGIKNLVLECE